MLRANINILSRLSATILLAVTALIFASVLLRYLFNLPIPDTNDISRLSLGVALMGGIALASYGGRHITMDAVWLAAGDRGKYWIDVTATLITFLALAALANAIIGRVIEVWHSNEGTFDLGLPLWVFYGLTAVAAVFAVLLSFVRLVDVVLKRQSAVDIETPIND